MGVKNRALALSIEKFDAETQTAAQANFVDKEQQKVFAEFVRKNTKMQIDDVELQGDNAATAKLTIRTFSPTLYPELKTISGKDWKPKAEAAMESKIYNLKLAKDGDTWKIGEQTESGTANQ